MKKQTEELIDKLAEKIPFGGKPIIALVLIGRVLAKMQDIKGGEEDIQEDLVLLWQPCGYERSIQEMVEKSGWEEFTPNAKDPGCMICDNKKCEHNTRLKDPAVNKLITFLLTIFK